MDNIRKLAEPKQQISQQHGKYIFSFSSVNLDRIADVFVVSVVTVKLFATISVSVVFTILTWNVCCL